MVNTAPAPAALTAFTAPWRSSSHLQTCPSTHTNTPPVKHGMQPTRGYAKRLRFLRDLQMRGPNTNPAHHVRLLLARTKHNPRLGLPRHCVGTRNPGCVLAAQGSSVKEHGCPAHTAKGEQRSSSARGAAEAGGRLQPTLAAGWLHCWSPSSWPPLQRDLLAEHKDSL